MLEIYVIVQKKKSLMMKFLMIFSFVIGAFFLYASLLGLLLYFALAVLFVALGWFLKNRSMEYEYSYFDGDFRFAKIINKQKRKELTGYVADNVTLIAPKGDRSLHQYESNPQTKRRDLSSGNKNAKIYVMVVNAEAGYQLTYFEPDEAYLDAVCVKYRQKVVR